MSGEWAKPHIQANTLKGLGTPTRKDAVDVLDSRERYACSRKFMLCYVMLACMWGFAHSPEIAERSEGQSAVGWRRAVGWRHGTLATSCDTVSIF